MQDKLDLRDEVIAACLSQSYGVESARIEQIVAALPTRIGALWTSVDRFAAILYPFVDGTSGREVGLSPAQWLEFGAVLKAVHAAELPPEIARRLPREEFIPTPRFTVVVLDLMFVMGTALRGFVAGSPDEEAFFRGYGRVEIVDVAYQSEADLR